MATGSRKALRDAGWTVELAVEETDTSQAIYVAERGSYSDDPRQSTYVLTYAAEDSLVDLL